MDPSSSAPGGVVSGPLVAGQAPGQAPPAQLQKPRRRVLTSLALQIFIFFGGWWDVAYYILNILVFVYKGALRGTMHVTPAGHVPCSLRTTSCGVC